MAFYCSISNVSPMLLLRELIETVEQNTQLRKQLSALTAQNQQQVSPETCLKTVRPSQLGQLLNPLLWSLFWRNPTSSTWSKISNRATKPSKAWSRRSSRIR